MKKEYSKIEKEEGTYEEIYKTAKQIKRDPLPRSERSSGGSSVIPVPTCIVTQYASSCVVAVSYTHLDVYKRQGVCSVKI